MSQKSEFDIENVMKEVKENSLRYGFVSECDFQFIIGVAIMKLYKDATVVMEYEYPRDTLLKEGERQYIDILVIMNNKYYPIELKYKHKGCEKLQITNDLYCKLTNYSCTTEHRINYCEDIDRLLELRKTKEFNVAEGYAILLTNYEQFRNKTKSGRQQEKYLLYEDEIKDKGVNEIKAKYKEDYYMEWFDFDKFSYLLTKIYNKEK